MPIYPWYCKDTDETVEIIRSFSDIESGPTDEELKDLKATSNDHWERKIGNKIQKKLTNQWGFGKPNSSNPPLSKRIR